MPGFAVQQARAGQFDDPPTDGFAQAPTSFLGAVEAAWDDGWQTRNTGVRTNRLRDELFQRQGAIRRAIGQAPKPSNLLTATGDANALRDEDYEKAVEDLRLKFPEALAKIETRDQLMARIGKDLGDVRARAEAAGQQRPIASFVGGAGAAIADPLNLIGGVATGAVGVGKPLLVRMLAQAGVNAGLEAAQIPLRMADAGVVGPEYRAQEAIADVGFAAGGAAGLELLGAGLKAGWSRAFGSSAEPAVRRAAEQLDRTARDDAVLGPVDGLSHEEGLDALDNLRPPPRQEPAQDLADLFDGGAPSTASRSPSPLGGGITGAAEYRGRAILQGVFDPREIETDAARFQYKADADAAGVTARLRGVDAWDPTSSGKVIVFEQADGRRFIADGHQRRALALRMDEQGWDARLDGYLFREADGWTARQVRTVAALKNMREGSGTILDAAKVFRDAPEHLNDRSLPVTGDFISQARNLARLSGEAFGAVINKVIPERYGAEIGAMAGERPDLHPGLVKLMRDGQPANIEEARALVSESLLDDWVKREGEQADFFGDLPPESTTIARAKVKAAVVAALKKDARIYGLLVKNADAIEAGGNVLIRDANETAAVVNRTALEILSRLSLRAGDVGDAMAAAARAVLDGKRPGDAAKGIVQMVRGRLKTGEDLDGFRAAAIAPEAPPKAATEALAGVDEPAFWEAQTREAPEDADLEAPGLFDDLDELGDAERAHQRLIRCAPGVAAE